MGEESLEIRRQPDRAAGALSSPRAYAFHSLAPTARRLLQAAHQVLERDGYEGLTLRRIAAEAGATKSLIIYHFDSKAGLVAHLVDFLWHDADVALRERVDRTEAAPRDQLDALIDLHERLALQKDTYRLYFELLPHVAGDEDVRARVTEFYRAYREFGAQRIRSVAPGLATSEPLAAALLAIGEGVPVQTLLLAEPVPTRTFFALSRGALQAYLGLNASRRERGYELPTDGVPSSRAAGSAASAAAGDERGMVKDPTTDLSPVAAHVLRGAVTVLKRDGLRALTLDAVAAESGEPRSSVSYHLGDKRAMVLRVLDFVNHATQALVEEPPRRGGRPAEDLIAARAREALLDRGGRRAFFELLPAVLRDSELKARQAAFVDWLLGRLAAEVATAEMPQGSASWMAASYLALVHGLSMQSLVEPDTFDPVPALEAWTAALQSWAAASRLEPAKD
jgi:TetR/AcrR family transcriptional regulator, transcriptional repressor of aconitase